MFFWLPGIIIFHIAKPSDLVPQRAISQLPGTDNSFYVVFRFLAAGCYPKVVAFARKRCYGAAHSRGGFYALGILV
jgi:hypothetical protein